MLEKLKSTRSKTNGGFREKKMEDIVPKNSTVPQLRKNLTNLLETKLGTNTPFVSKKAKFAGRYFSKKIICKENDYMEVTLLFLFWNNYEKHVWQKIPSSTQVPGSGPRVPGPGVKDLDSGMVAKDPSLASRSSMSTKDLAQPPRSRGQLSGAQPRRTRAQLGAPKLGC